jgi:DNA-binding NtrC family response regulator
MILILDDTPAELELIERAMLKAGITDFLSFTKVKPFLKAVTPDTKIVLIDHNLSAEMTGLATMKTVLHLNPLCFPIIVTGVDDPEIIISYTNNNCFRYILRKGSLDYLDQIVLFINEATEMERLVKKRLAQNG